MKKCNKQHYTLFFYLAILVVLAFGGINLDDKTSEKNTALSAHHEQKTVRIGFPGISNSTLEAGGIAINQQYFIEELAKVGFKPEIVFFQQAGPALNEALASDKIDVALYGDLPIAILRTKGAPVKVFAIDNSRLQFGTIVQSESPAKNIAALQGEKVIFGKGTVQQRYFKEITQFYGLNPDKFEMVNAVGADANSVFSGQQAEAMFTFYYTVLYMQQKGMGKVIDSTLDKPELSSQSLAVGREIFLQENPQAAVAIIRALQRAKQFASQNPEQVFKIFSQNNIPADIYRQAYSADLSFSNFDPKITQESVNKLSRLIDFLVENKLVNNRINVEELITTEYYERFLQEK
ncbi:nitrate ABC transporter substrate-binding protein [Lonepinella koalarum]|uniref:ABC transporter substrate-binding protein n=1 Tax=Lonepinella koalarum TaxID=53417 RepID=UPI0011E43670|nr:ABC transporter substrate-binding protein [Lonepinella koalarum]TYG35510.1 nitrate ABC transporter substrate-binding protein [Lonepinella koalarum]